SGGSGVRATVFGARMGVGILSGGDAGANALSGNAGVTGAPNNSVATPLRALAIDFDNGDGYTQATVGNVTSGKYRLWSQAQAITVAPYANPTANDTGANAYKPINGDQNDQSGSPTSAAEPGIHRKFIHNIRNSIATANPASSQITPADFIMNGGFILPQVMSVTKNLDSDTSYGSQTPDATLYNSYANGIGKVMYDKTNWADPHKTDGNLAGG